VVGRSPLDEYIDHYDEHRRHRTLQQSHLPGVRIHLLQAQTSGFSSGTGPAA